MLALKEKGVFKILTAGVRTTIRRCQAKRSESLPPKLSNKPSNTTHPPKDPPEYGYDPECLGHSSFKIPYYIRPASFRQFDVPTEVLGPDAAKNNNYKNPEYFSYHRYSFVELQNHALRFRDERRKGAGLQVVYEEDEDDEDDEDDNDYHGYVDNDNDDDKNTFCMEDDESREEDKYKKQDE